MRVTGTLSAVDPYPVGADPDTAKTATARIDWQKAQGENLTAGIALRARLLTSQGLQIVT